MWTFIRLHARKIVFLCLVSVLYYSVAHPSTYNFVGSIVSLDEYDNANKPDRYTLLIVHSVIMGCLSFLLLLVYNPMNETK